MKQYQSGEEFLNKIYPNLNQSKEVKHIGNFGNKEETIKKYLERLNFIHKTAFSSKNQNAIDLLKEFYYQKYVIKEENIKENYKAFLDKQYFDENGIHMSEEEWKKRVTTIIEDQKSSLDTWIDYLSSEDAKFYPMWAKYWAFQGMLGIGGYDNQNGIYKKREKSTIAPFIELNQEALAKCIDYMEKYVNKNHIAEEALETIISNGNFSKLYILLLKRFKKIHFAKNSLNGIWVKYLQGDDYLPLYNSLQGYGTEWCTAGESTCKAQIANGDFYVYYTYDEKGESKIPRIAIRMDGKLQIGEIRGVAIGQNVESYLEKVLEKKLEEFPDKDKYQKRMGHQKKLTFLYEKYQRKEELNREELSFLYGISEKIEVFGYREDPRIQEIIKSRNTKKDYATIFLCDEEEVALSQNEFEFNPKQFKVLIGNLDLSNLTSAKDIVLPNILIGDLNLRSLKSAEGLILPSTMNGDLDLRDLASAKNLNLPSTMNGSLHLESLTSAEGLILPSTVNGFLYLSGLTSAEGLTLPNTINGFLYLDGLTSAKGLILPNTMNGGLDLSGLTSAEGLNLPSTLNGDLDLSSLTSAEGLILPDIIKGFLHLESLTTAEGLILPDDFDLTRLYCSDFIKEELIEKRKSR